MDKKSVLRKFGSNLRKLRIKSGLSQEELAAKARVHRNYLGGVERGERNLTLTKFMDIAGALDCSAARLLFGLQEKFPLDKKK